MQIVPELAKEAGELTVYQRTATHVLPKVDFEFDPAVRRLFARVPAAQRALRWVTDVLLEIIMIVGALHFKESRGRGNISASDLAKINRFRWIRDKELRAKLTPDYDCGCKRPTFSNSFYRVLTQPNVHLETNPIERIEPDGIVTADGRKTVIDTLVLATGFDLWEANFPAIEVIGRKGRNLGKWWRETRFQAYQGVSMPYFPNYLSLASPFAFSGLSFFHTIEYQMRHMDRLLGEVMPRRDHLRGHRGGQRPVHGADDQTAGQFSVLRRQLRHLAVVLLQSQRRGLAAAADVDAELDPRSQQLPAQRLRHRLARPAVR